MAQDINIIMADSHQKAMKKAMKKLPEKKVTDIIAMAVKCATHEISPTDAAKTLCKEYEPAFKAYVSAFSQQAVKDALKDTEFKDLQKLAKPAFAKKLKKTTDKVSVQITKYMNGEMEPEELIKQLMNSGIGDVGRDVIQACGVDLKSIPNKGNVPIELASPIVGYMAICRAYEIMMAALDEASAAYEHRLLIEEECRKSVLMIQEYRARMEAVVSDYLNEHIETFENGFAAMDQAILENDTDGYIRGNVEIQKILKYDVQFTNQEEFDDLMDSDIALKM